MASNNRLLGSGKVYTKSDVKQTQPLNDYAPHWMFHKDHPEGQIVRNQVTFDKLVAAGWVRHPGQCTLLPGHEAMYEGDREVEETEKTKKKKKVKATEEASEEELEVPEYRTEKQKKLFDPDK